jgi:hypothetical protein
MCRSRAEFVTLGLTEKGGIHPCAKEIAAAQRNNHYESSGRSHAKQQIEMPLAYCRDDCEIRRTSGSRRSVDQVAAADSRDPLVPKEDQKMSEGLVVAPAQDGFASVMAHKPGISYRTLLGGSAPRTRTLRVVESRYGQPESSTDDQATASSPNGRTVNQQQ